MGFGIKELVVILVIVLLLFGTKKLRNIGSDLGGAIRGFRNSMKGEDDTDATADNFGSEPDGIDADKPAQSKTAEQTKSDTKHPGA